MFESMKVAIEEWAGDCSVSVTDEQIKDLADAIEICSEMDLGSRGFSLGHKSKSEEESKIEELEKRLRTLELFISSNGLSVSYGAGYVTEHTMENISGSHRASNDKTTFY